MASVIPVYVCRLSESCIKCIAAHLLELAPQPLFASLVQASSGTVRDRQETDTVPLVDDLRYHLEQLHGDGELSSGKSCVPSLAENPISLDTSFLQTRSISCPSKLLPRMPGRLW